MEDLEKILGKFGEKRIAVVGDVMLDRFIYGVVERFSPEEPGVPIVKMQRKENKLGGAGNVASNIISLGGQCTLYGLVGNDKDGRIIDSFTKEGNINSIWIKDGRETTIKTRVTAVTGNQTRQLCRFDEEKTKDISKSLAYSIIKSVKENNFDGIILQDYGKGLLSKYLLEQAVLFANGEGIPIFFDPKNRLVKNVTIFKPNEDELFYFSRRKNIESALISLYKKIEPKYLVATVGKEGMYFYDGSDLEHIKTIKRDVVDVMGAGDTVISALALSYASGANIYEACDIANHAAGVVVQKKGTATVNLDEIRKSFKDNGVV